MKSVTLLSFFLVLTSVAWGVRHVGTGGGDAELKVVEMASSLPIWSQACNQNPQLCWKQRVQLNLPVLTETIVEFVDTPTTRSVCDGAKVQIERAALYEIDGKTAKPDRELADVLIQSLVSCRAELSPARGLNVNLLPLATMVGDTGIYVLPADTTEVIATNSGGLPLHIQLIARTQCTRYHVFGSQDQSFEIQCLDKTWRFLIEVQTTDTGITLFPRYEGAEN